MDDVVAKSFLLLLLGAELSKAGGGGPLVPSIADTTTNHNYYNNLCSSRGMQVSWFQITPQKLKSSKHASHLLTIQSKLGRIHAARLKLRASSRYPGLAATSTRQACKNIE